MIFVSNITGDLRKLVKFTGLDTDDIKRLASSIILKEAGRTAERLRRQSASRRPIPLPNATGPSIPEVVYTRNTSTKYKAAAEVGFDSSELSYDRQMGLNNMLGRKGSVKRFWPRRAKMLAFPVPGRSPNWLWFGGRERPGGQMTAREAKEHFAWYVYTPTAILGREYGSRGLQFLFKRKDYIEVEARVDMEHESRLLTERCRRKLVEKFPDLLRIGPSKRKK